LPDKQVKPLLADGKYADLASELTGNFPYLVSEFNRVLREVKPETESLMGEDTKNNLKKVFLQQIDGTMQGALNSHFFLTNGTLLSLKKLLSELATVPEEDKRELEKMGVLLKIDETYQLNPPLLNDFVKS
jgi:hypothetical protein